MRPRFEEFGVSMVAVSADTHAEAAKMQSKLKLGITVLSDENLEVIDLYGVRHANGIAPSRGMLRPLAVPTTILVDGQGVVRWIDQSDDYRIRSDAPRVLAAVRAALGPADA